MQIKEFFSSSDQSHWIGKMKACDWGAGQWLSELLSQNKLQELVGQGALVPMGMSWFPLFKSVPSLLRNQ